MWVDVSTLNFKTVCFQLILNPFSTGKIKKHDFWGSNVSTNFKHPQLENHKCKVYQPAYHQKTYQILFEKHCHEGNFYSYRFWDIAAGR